MTPLTDAQKIDGSKSKSTINSLLDEFSRKCLAIGVQRKLNATDVVGAITDLFTLRGVPESIHLRLHNGPGFVALRFQDWLKRVGVSHCRSIHAAHGGMDMTNASTEHLDEKCLMLNGSTANNLRSQSMSGSGNIIRSDPITHWV
jgi:hypothetical protein